MNTPKPSLPTSLESTLGAQAKFWLESKTILFNLLVTVAALIATGLQILEPAMPVLSHILPAPATAALVSVVCAANVVLRTITSMGITFKQPDALPQLTSADPGAAP